MTVLIYTAGMLALLVLGFLIGFTAGKQATRDLIFRRMALRYPREYKLLIKAMSKKGLRK